MIVPPPGWSSTIMACFHLLAAPGGVYAAADRWATPNAMAAAANASRERSLVMSNSIQTGDRMWMTRLSIMSFVFAA